METTARGGTSLANLTVAGIKLAPKLIKIGLALTSVVAYSYLFTWQFALVIVASIFLHECGHLAAMKHYHLKTKGIYLIPFFGGAAVSEETFPTRRAEVVIATAGPLAGLIMSIIGAAIYFTTSAPFWAATASWIALVTLFNLLPVTPLDGGRVVKSVILSLNSRLSIFTYFTMAALAVYVMFTQKLWIFILLLVIGTSEFFYERKHPGDKPAMTPLAAWLSLAVYIALGVALWVVMLTMGQEPGAAAAMEVLQG